MDRAARNLHLAQQIALAQNVVIRYRIFQVRDETYIEKFTEAVLPPSLESCRKIAMCFEWFQDRVDPQVFVSFEIF